GERPQKRRPHKTDAFEMRAARGVAQELTATRTAFAARRAALAAAVMVIAATAPAAASAFEAMPSLEAAFSRAASRLRLTVAEASATTAAAVAAPVLVAMFVHSVFTVDGFSLGFFSAEEHFYPAEKAAGFFRSCLDGGPKWQFSGTNWRLPARFTRLEGFLFATLGPKDRAFVAALARFGWRVV
ncbi:MAG: hypothetical protein KGJ37_06305, partial [Verrucomicrobiota bacterium]|nr:hypothetical protein [Verrucomicrobiota bacterium]